MAAFKDLTGQRFGKLTAVERTDGKWLCVCDCGTTTVVARNNLTRPHTLSCGCAKVEQLVDRRLRHGAKANRSRTPEYSTWVGIITRCENPKVEGYKHYGARGVRICERWRSDFANFLADMGPRPSRGHSIDRINVEGNYEPGNCRWATSSEQARNKRTTRNITVNGETRCITEWAASMGANMSTIHRRLTSGWSDARAVTEPVHSTGRKPTGEPSRPAPDAPMASGDWLW